MRKLFAPLAFLSLLTLAGCTNGLPEDIGASTEAICCGSNCCCPSLGTGGPINAGDINPANACERCDPATTQTAWTPIPGCVPDSGTGDTDSGTTTGTDSGTATGTDSGTTTGTDSGTTTGTDAGTDPGDGGGCSVGTRGRSRGAAVLFGLAMAAIVIRRRRG